MPPTSPASPRQPVRARALRHPRRIVIKLHDGSLVQGQPPAAFRQRLAQLRQRLPALRAFQPLFAPADWGPIADRQLKAIGADPSYRPVDFATFHRLVVGATAPIVALLAELTSWEEVEYAYVEPVGSAPADPYFAALQHFKAAPEGVGLAAAWGAGEAISHGQGVRIGDVERGWYVGHDEFDGLLPTDAAGAPLTQWGVPQSAEEDREHGTQVLGILYAQQDEEYYQGAADHAAAIELYSYVGSDGLENLAAAAMAATLRLGAGDVLLMEVQLTEDAEYPSFVNHPCEIAPAVFAVLRLASAVHITVVEAAGNGATDLDVPLAAGGPWMPLAPAAAAFEDSGALIVGASQWSLKPIASTNYGSRVNLFALGESVFTTSLIGGGEPPLPYGSCSGTSAAAAIVAGVAAVVQGAARHLRGTTYSPAQLRWLLAHPERATDSDDPANDRIGRMPDLAKVFAGKTLPATPELYLRDHVGDDGTAHAGALSSSPDVILRREKAADPEAAFGAASGLLDDLGLHQSAVAGATHWLYARAHDRGGAAADAVSVALWWSKPATLIYPDEWTPIGVAAVPTVPAGGVAVSDALEWPDAPDPGHYCFLAILHHEADPAPVVPDFGGIVAAGYDAWSAFKTFLRRANNATWRNFNVEAAAAGSSSGAEAEAEALVRGAPDRARRMRFTLRAGEGVGEVGVLVPSTLWKEVDTTSAPKPAGAERGGTLLRVPAGGELAFEAELPVRAKHALRFRFRPCAVGASGAEFCVIQSECGDGGLREELGRVTWRWTAAKKP